MNSKAEAETERENEMRNRRDEKQTRNGTEDNLIVMPGLAIYLLSILKNEIHRHKEDEK